MSLEKILVVDVIGYAFLPAARSPQSLFGLKALSGLSGFCHHFPEGFIRGSWSLYWTKLVPQTRVIHPLSDSYRFYLVTRPSLTEWQSTSVSYHL